MSTTTLLIVSASLRSHGRGRRHARTASPVVHCGRGLASWGLVPHLTVRVFRRAGAGILPFCFPHAGRSALQPAGAGAQILPLRARAVPWTRAAALLGLLVFALAGSGVLAQAPQDAATQVAAPDITLPPVRVEADPEASVRIGGKPPATGPCVVVDIQGHRAGHLDCATQALQDAADVARRDADAARDVSVAGAGSPDVEVGVASRAGTRLRLRENFGKSVRPPAVPTPVYTNPMGRTP